MELADTVAKCKDVCLQSPNHFVHINRERVSAFAKSINLEDLEETTKDSSVNKQVDRSTKAAVYLAYNAVNFSFYPDEGDKRWFAAAETEEGVIGKDDEAHAVVHCLNRAHQQNLVDLRSGAALAGLTLETVELIFKPHPDAGKLPLLAKRTECLNELGKAYLALGGGDAVQTLLDNCEGSCLKFISQLCKLCPCFNDVAYYAPLAATIAFHKRAQLCASMLHSDGILTFKDIDSLTVFADYRLPQLFCQIGIFEYRDDLKQKVSNREPIQAKSDAEIEIRAATIYASQLVIEEIGKRDSAPMPSLHLRDLDYYLWRTAVSLAEGNDTPLQIERLNDMPFHRCRSCYY